MAIAGRRRPKRAPSRRGPGSPSVREAMLHLICGYCVSQLVFVAARLNVADALAAGPLSTEKLAKCVGAKADHLYRVLRTLASLGVFAELPGRRFRLTPLAETLCSDHPRSLRDFALMTVDDWNWQAWGALEHGVITGDNAFEHVYGMSPFAYLRQHPDKERRFAAAMASISAAENSAVAAAYPFGRLRCLVDVGGAHGHMLAEILRRHKRLTGVLYDQPQVVAGASQSGFITAPDIRARCAIEGGNFFHSVPKGADGYIMKYVVHDWDDEKCIRILRNCRAAMAPKGRVLVVDDFIAKGKIKTLAKILDVSMMIMLGGRVRSHAEFNALLGHAGLRLARVIPTRAGLGIVEAMAA
jgi:adenine/guanine phosphoribosyltransferase-like PRPP-binding protein